MWLLTSVDDAAANDATSHLLELPQYHEWTLHDLSIIWRTLLGRGQVRPLIRGFELFQKVKKSRRRSWNLQKRVAFTFGKRKSSFAMFASRRSSS